MNISEYQCSSLPVSSDRLNQSKRAYTTRRVDWSSIQSLVTDAQPTAGDLVLAEVDKIGQHKRIELETGRRASLFPGDEIVVCYGNRYAPDQYHSELPIDLSLCQLVAAGGIASKVLSKNSAISEPTAIRPLGLLCGKDNKPINIARWGFRDCAIKKSRPLVIAVAGTSMNAGKTSTASFLIKGLTRAGMKVGAAKLTGTGAGGDRWLMLDAGAIEVADFTDMGYCSTYQIGTDELESIQSQLIAHLENKGAEAIVLEIADGLYQRETSMLLNSPYFKANIDLMIFAAGDARAQVRVSIG